jgi:hypothetical protein
MRGQSSRNLIRVDDVLASHRCRPGSMLLDSSKHYSLLPPKIRWAVRWAEIRRFIR